MANVGHFTWFNADYFSPARECFVITLVDQFGNFIPNQYFQATGISAGVTWDHGTSLATAQNLISNCVMTPIGSQITITVPSFGVTQPIPPGSGVASSCFLRPCTPVEVVLQVVPPVICTPGSSQTCAYTGPPGTLGVGICQAGSNYCINGGTAWSGCDGEIVPEAETCTTIFDDNCNGEVNEAGALDCGCAPVKCRPARADRSGRRASASARGGTRSCDVFFGEYGPCVGEVTPGAEDCMTPADENCNGISGCEGEAVWATGFGNDSAVQGRDIAVNGLGEVYTVGIFAGAIDFGVRGQSRCGAPRNFSARQD